MATSREFNFTNSAGQKLSGRLELPTSAPIAFAVFAHCFTCSKNILAASRISKTLATKGVAVLRFDFTGLGNSEGDFANTNFSSNVSDLKDAYEAMAKEFDVPAIMIGHSLGGAATLRLAESLDRVKAVVTIGAPSDTQHVSHLFADDVPKINAEGAAEVDLAGRKFTIKKQFIDDINSQDVLKSLEHSRKAYLIMHSPVDQTVSIDHAATIYGALKHPKSFVTLDKADHLVMNPQDAAYIADVISTWVSRYIDVVPPSHQTPKGDVLVTTRRGHKFTQDIYSKDHHLVGDEPPKVHGDDLGMNPYELLLSALGACTSMTMKMYADRKGFPMETARVDLKHERKYTEDCVQCEEKPALLDHITKTITLTGDLTDEQRQRILEIAEKCPVNKTLKSEIIIRTE